MRIEFNGLDDSVPRKNPVSSGGFLRAAVDDTVGYLF